MLNDLYPWLSQKLREARELRNKFVRLTLSETAQLCDALHRPYGTAERDEIVAALHLEWDNLARGWWLPAEPGPVMCRTIPDAVRKALELADNDVRLANEAETRALTFNRADADG